jgi:hypothetical protein
VSQAETNAALAAVDAAVADGRLSADEGQHRRARIRRAVTPRDLWKASGGLAGNRRSGDPWRKHVRTGILIVVGCVVAMLIVLYFTAKHQEISFDEQNQDVHTGP